MVSVPYSISVAAGFVMLFGLYRHWKSHPTVLDIDIHNYRTSCAIIWPHRETGRMGDLCRASPDFPQVLLRERRCARFT